MDDCWQADARDSQSGAPIAHPDKFPHGIKALADEIHSMGLKVIISVVFLRAWKDAEDGVLGVPFWVFLTLVRDSLEFTAALEREC